MSEIALLTEIRDLLLLMAKDKIAARDKRLRDELLTIAGKGKLQQAAVLLMDGSRRQGEIQKKAGIDPAQLSRLLKALREKKLLNDERENPKIVIPLPSDFFEKSKRG